jgi:hypothetical protein
MGNTLKLPESAEVLENYYWYFSNFPNGRKDTLYLKKNNA